MQKGMLGELLAHILINNYIEKLKVFSPYFNKEEANIRKGFDVLYIDTIDNISSLFSANAFFKSSLVFHSSCFIFCVIKPCVFELARVYVYNSSPSYICFFVALNVISVVPNNGNANRNYVKANTVFDLIIKFNINNFIIY